MGRYLTHRSDSTAAAIRQALEQVAVVWAIGQPVDYLVLYRGRLFGIDAKGPKTPKQPAQIEFFASGAPGGYAVTPEDALRLIGAMR